MRSNLGIMPGLAYDHRDAGRGGPQGSAEEGGSVIQPRVCDLSCLIPNKTFCLRSSLTRCHMKRRICSMFTHKLPPSQMLELGPIYWRSDNKDFRGILWVEPT